MVEVKPARDDAWLTAGSDRVSRYWGLYRLAGSAAGFELEPQHPRAFANAAGPALSEHPGRRSPGVKPWKRSVSGHSGRREHGDDRPDRADLPGRRREGLGGYEARHRRPHPGRDRQGAGADVREGLAAVISVRLQDPQFEGQTKTKLGNAETRTAAESVVAEGLTRYLEDNQAEAKRIIEKCLTSRKAREAARRAREMVIRKNAMDGSSLPGKLSDCSERDPSRSELYVSRESRRAAPPRWAGTGPSRPSCPSRARS